MDKSPDAFRTISEVAEILDIPQHVLRFWETRFTQIKPLKRGGGRRYYRPADVDFLKGIQQLLYGQGYTIKGAQRLIKENGVAFVVALGVGEKAALETIAKKNKGQEIHDNSTEVEKKQPKSLLALMKADVDGLLGKSNKKQGKDDTTLLNEALFELIECKRLLDRAR